MPPMLNPVETMPNTRPAAPGGAALRTSMSRAGCTMPSRKPVSPMESPAPARAAGPRQWPAPAPPRHRSRPRPRGRAGRCGRPGARRRGAHGRGGEIGGEGGGGGRRRDAVAGDQRRDGEGRHGAAGQGQQGEEQRQSQHRRGQDSPAADLRVPRQPAQTAGGAVPAPGTQGGNGPGADSRHDEGRRTPAQPPAQQQRRRNAPPAKPAKVCTENARPCGVRRSCRLGWRSRRGDRRSWQGRRAAAATISQA